MAIKGHWRNAVVLALLTAAAGRDDPISG